MQCPRCQAENRDGRRFCGECGLSFASTCPACGFLNEGSEKFCGGCGRSLTLSAAPAGPKFHSPHVYTPKHLVEKILTSRSALEGERKQVTVLFADLKGSMELLADRDPEEARKLLDPVLERMMEDRVEELSRLLGIAVGQELHRPFQVCKQNGHLLALTFQRASRGEDLLNQVLGRVDMWRMELGPRGGCRQGERSAASAAELLAALVQETARRARRGERQPALAAEAAAVTVLSLTPRTL